MGKDKAGDSSADRDARAQNEDHLHMARGWPAVATSRTERGGDGEADRRARRGIFISFFSFFFSGL